MSLSTVQQAKIDAMSEEEKERWIDLWSLALCSAKYEIDGVNYKAIYWRSDDDDVDSDNLLMVQTRICLRAVGHKVLKVVRLLERVIKTKMLYVVTNICWDECEHIDTIYNRHVDAVNEHQYVDDDSDDEAESQVDEDSDSEEETQVEEDEVSDTSSADDVIEDAADPVLE